MKYKCPICNSIGSEEKEFLNHDCKWSKSSEQQNILKGCILWEKAFN